MLRLVIRMGLAISMERCALVSSQRWIGPLALRLQEESECIAADAHAVGNRVLNAYIGCQ